MNFESNPLLAKSQSIGVSQSYGSSPQSALVNNKKSSTLSEEQTEFNSELVTSVNINSIDNRRSCTRFETLSYY